MINKENVNREFELYKPMCIWLKQYLIDKYKNFNILVLDTHNERLDRVLEHFGIKNELAQGVDIQIDVLGIAKKENNIKLFFIEAKKQI